MESKEFKALKEQLLSCRRNGFDRMDAAERSAMESYCTDYKAFLDTSKTERLCAGEVVRLAEQAGYRPYVRGAAVKPGDKVYLCNRGKSVLLALSLIHILTICERDIARAEERIAALEADMEAAACDYEKLNELVGQKAAAQAELDALYERWEQLSEEAEG